MLGRRALRYGEGDGWQAVELPYKSNKLAMDVILPRSGQFQAVEQQLTAGLEPFVAGLTSTPVQLAFRSSAFALERASSSR